MSKSDKSQSPWEAMEKSLDLSRLPAHVAVIMDGNRRWAKNRGLPSFMGHREGTERVRTITTAAREIGIRHLTIYAFSRENWRRSQDEVKFLMGLFREYCNSERQLMKDRGIRFSVLGDMDLMDPALVEIFTDVMDYTKDGKAMSLNVCVNYGSRREILSAVEKIAQDIALDKLNPKEIDEEVFSRYLYTKGQPDPDLIIRTSGEMRLSNFLLWQAAYSEFYFTDVLWPDFHRGEFIKALLHYQQRNRRFGGNSDAASEKT